MVSLYKIETVDNMYYVNPEVTSFRVTEYGISVLGHEMHLVNIKPEQITIMVLSGRDLLNALKRDYRKLNPPPAKTEEENREERDLLHKYGEN